MKTLAALLVETGKPLVVDEIDIPDLRAGQVLVEIGMSGLCHTQILESRGYRGADPFLPHCLGHEGVGRVVDVGPGVVKVKDGDRVLLSWMKGSGADVPGTVYGWNGKQVNAGGITTFSRHAVISENRLILCQQELSDRDAALLGCAVATGMGAVLNTAAVSAGQSIAVFGTGGIGLCAVAGASIAGCFPVIGVDVRDSKLRLARQMGATHTLDASKNNVSEQVKALSQGGLDVVIESSGHPEVMTEALSAVRSQGGVAVVVGNARHGERLSLDPRELNQGKQLRGTWGGDNFPDKDFSRYMKLIRSGRLDLSPLTKDVYSLLQINQAMDDLESGVAVRPLIDMSLDAK